MASQDIRVTLRATIENHGERDFFAHQVKRATGIIPIVDAKVVSLDCYVDGATAEKLIELFAAKDRHDIELNF